MLWQEIISTKKTAAEKIPENKRVMDWLVIYQKYQSAQFPLSKSEAVGLKALEFMCQSVGISF